MLFDDSSVAVILVQLGDQQRVGESPADGAGPLSEVLSRDAHERSRLGEPPVFTPGIPMVGNGLRIEGGHVVVVDRHFARGDDIPAILEFFPGGAVGLDTEEVAEEGPSDHFLNTVEALVRATERTG